MLEYHFIIGAPATDKNFQNSCMASEFMDNTTFHNI